MSTRNRAGVYVDGYNLFYGALKGTKFKWLDIAKLVSKQVPWCDPAIIAYCTAHVKPRAHDPQQGVRQQAYFRALETTPGLEIILGQFVVRRATFPVHPQPTPRPVPPQLVGVTRTEEKGSDVNIASRMIRDGCLGRYDMAILISGDSDLVEPVKIVRNDLGLDVIVLRPGEHRQCVELKRVATAVVPIRKSFLKKSQFPDTMKDSTGTFHKPVGW